jgi:hypothetical protein
LSDSHLEEKMKSFKRQDFTIYLLYLLARWERFYLAFDWQEFAQPAIA